MIRVFAVVMGLVCVGALAGLLSSDKGRRSFVLALRSLWLHKLRSFLSVLGIIIGTLAVIVLMAFGEGSMHDALEDIKRQGATNIIIRSVKPADSSNATRRNWIAIYGLTYEDYDRFANIGTVTRRVPMRIFPADVRHLDRMHSGRVVATIPAYTEVNQVQLAAGSFITEQDDHYMLNVAVLGARVADSLFPFDDPIGKTVRLDKYYYKVVGVMRDRMPTGAIGGTSQSGEDYNDDVYIPLQTCKVRYGQRIFSGKSGSFSAEQVELHQITLTCTDMDKVRPTGEVIKQLLDQYHTKKNDYAVTVPLDRLEAAERERDRFTRLLVVIASISLLVGGIGIMNIMLATVTERTREIGIRRALGAKRRDITLQFLIEAIVQTSVGGLVGVSVGLAAVFLIPWAYEAISHQHLPAVVNVDSIFYSLGVSVTVGVLFGWYPSRRAALLDPIEALRHE